MERGAQVSDEHRHDWHAITRRSFLAKAGGAGLTLASSGVLAGCGGVKKSGGGGSADTLKIGLVTPRTGQAAGFGEVDPYIVDLVKKATASGVKGGDGKTYKIQILARDSQSSPQRAAEVAKGLINSDQIDFMLASSTPEVVNPVADACEAAGVPCMSTVLPWQAWYFGRGAKEDDKAAFKFTYHFSFGVENFATGYFDSWKSIKTNKVVGALYPNDADGNAIRAGFIPAMKKAGFKVVDAGPYNDGLNDFSAQIAKFKQNNCQIFNTFPLPPDFATFWRQAAQQGYRPIIPQIAKTGLFPSQVEALGNLGHGLVGTAFWTRTFPYSSSLLKKSSKELADGYEATGKQWTQMVGSTAALFDVGMAMIAHAPNPKDKQGMADSIATLKVDTPLGHLDWTQGPVKNVVTTPLINCQWLPTPDAKYPLQLTVIDNADDKQVPVAAKLKPYPDFVA
jgi:branched-chain amino acid transport system substrate-binding protein